MTTAPLTSLLDDSALESAVDETARQNGAHGDPLEESGPRGAAGAKLSAVRPVVKLNGSRRSLAELRPGERARIVAVGSTDERVHQRLLHMGLLRGRELVVLRRAPTGDPIEVRLLSYSLCLRRREASQIEVSPLP